MILSEKSKYIFPLLALFAVLTTACKKDDKNPDEDTSFDRAAMRAHYADNIIIPAYLDFQSEMAEVMMSAGSFVETPNTENLQELREDWKEAYESWQSCSMFEFGPAADVVLRSTCNTFPTDTTQIQNNINSGSWQLGTAANIPAAGLPAIGYLLYGVAPTDNAVVEMYTTAPNAQSRGDYLLDVVAQMNTKIAGVVNQWNSGYAASFKQKSGTDIGSALSLMVNDLNFDYELIKNAKIGIPLGVQTFGIARPDYTEAYYSGISKSLALESLRASRRVYLGETEAGVNGLGMDDLLLFLGAQHTNGTLHSAIINQFAASETALEAIGDPLSESIVNSPEVVQNAYNKLQQHVVLFKTDMASSFGVLITYADGDGD